MGEDVRVMSDLKPGDHLCALYETEQQHQQLLTGFISDGLERNQKVIYIADSHTADVVLEYLEQAGINTADWLASGQLSLLTAEDSYLLDGSFDPGAMIDLLRREERQSIKEGYAALRITGEMTWVLRGQPGSERLIEYEVRLNDFFPRSRALALCQYDRWCFDAGILLGVISTHPIVVIGTESYDNFYFVPPKQLLGMDDASSTLNLWLEQLKTRKQLERSLRDSEKLYRTIFNSGNDAIFVYLLNEDMEPDEFLEISDEACAMLGYTREKLMRMNRLDFVTPDQLDSFRDYLKRVLKEEKALHETVLLTKNGRRIPVEINAHLIKLDGLRVVMSIDRDIGERKRAEEALRASEERFSKVFHSSPIAICITGIPEGRVLEANEAYLRLTGYAHDELIGRTTTERGLVSSFENREQIIEGLLRHGGFGDVDVQIRDRSGNILDLSASSVVTELDGLKCAITMLESKRSRQERWGLEP